MGGLTRRGAQMCASSFGPSRGDTARHSHGGALFGAPYFESRGTLPQPGAVRLSFRGPGSRRPSPLTDASLPAWEPSGENEESESPVLLVASLVPHTLAPKELVRGMFRARAKALWVDSLTQEPLQGVAKLLQGGEQGNWEVAAAERWKTSSGGAAASGAQGKQGTGFLSATPARSYKPRWLRAHSEGGWRYKGLKLDSSMPCLCTLREGRSSSFGASKSWIVEGQDPRDDSLWLLLDGPEGTGARPIAVRTAGTPTRPPERA